MKIYRNIDKGKYQFDFIVSVKEKGFYNDEIESLDGRIYYVPPKSKSFVKSFLGIRKIVKEQKYKYVIRVNEHSLSTLDLIAAKLGGAKILIMRSSNAGTAGGKTNKILHRIFKFLPKIIPNVKIAPSSEAACYTFGKKQLNKGKVKILHNAIPYEDFIFNQDIRNKMRKDLNIEDKLVIGHIGRFDEQKNHKFLVDIFEKIKEENKNAILLLVGKGNLENEIKKQVEELNLNDSVIFLGIRKDIPQLLMAMDIFVFPSLYEGMPNTVIEAQATGLKCIISDIITKEANITGLVNYVSINNTASEWKNIITENLNYKREDMSKIFKEKGYDITLVLEKKQGIFLNEINPQIKIIEYAPSDSKNIIQRKLINLFKRIN